MLEHVASMFDPAAYETSSLPKFPIPMGGQLSFSYGGPLSSAQRHINTINPGHLPISRPTDSYSNEPYEFHPDVVATAATFQAAAVLQLQKKLGLALELCEKKGVNVRTVVASGGVASNRYLRARLANIRSHP